MLYSNMFGAVLSDMLPAAALPTACAPVSGLTAGGAAGGTLQTDMHIHMNAMMRLMPI